MLESAPVTRTIKSSCYNIAKRRSSPCIEQQVRRLAQQSRRLAVPQAPLPSGPTPKAADLANYAAKLNSRSLLKPITETYTTFGAAERMFKECLRQADYTVPGQLKSPREPAPKNEKGEDIGEGTGQWFAAQESGGLALPVTFTNWAQVMFLHMYIYTVRIRRLDEGSARLYSQHLLDHFFQAAEDKMELLHGMAARGIRNKNLKDLWQQWRGAQLGYDEGLIRGDSTLGSAVWRAIFKADPNASIADIALVTAYMRREIQALDRQHGRKPIPAYQFQDLSGASSDLETQSALWTTAFTPEEIMADKLPARK